MDDARIYTKLANDCLERARVSSDPRAADGLIRLGLHWVSRARQAEQHMGSMATWHAGNSVGFVSNKLGIQWMTAELKRVLSKGLDNGKPVIIDGVMVLDALDQIQFTPDFLVFVKGERGWTLPSSHQALFDATKKRAQKLEAKGKPVEFKELLPMELDGDVTNIRNVSSKHWTRWLGLEHRCVVPFTSFSEFNRRPVATFGLR